MKWTFLLLLLVASIHAASPAEKFPDFMRLSKHEAVAAARRQASEDFDAGRYRILVYGLRATSEDKRFARDGVQVKPIAGCCVNDGIIEGARVYNEIMRAKLKAKLGRDVFDDAEKFGAAKR